MATKLEELERQVKANNKLLMKILELLQPDQHVPVNVKHFISQGKRKGLTALQTLDEINKELERAQ